MCFSTAWTKKQKNFKQSKTRCCIQLDWLALTGDIQNMTGSGPQEVDTGKQLVFMFVFDKSDSDLSIESGRSKVVLVLLVLALLSIG